MAQPEPIQNETTLIFSVLPYLLEPGASLRPGVDEREMVLAVPHGGISLARRVVTHSQINCLLARGLIRREAAPSRRLVITFAGEQAILGLSRHPKDAPEQIRLANRPNRLTGISHHINPKESPLAWLARRKRADGTPLINGLQLAAGERLRTDFTLAGLSPRINVDWARFGATMTSGIGHGGSATETMIAARQRVHAALDALGPDLAGLALDLCCFLKRISDVERERAMKQRTAKYHLMAALDRLVDHYRIGVTGPRQSLGIRVWTGADPHE